MVDIPAADDDQEHDALLQEWLQIRERHDRELARRFAEATRSGDRMAPPPGLSDADLEDLRRRVRQAKAAYDAIRQSSPDEP